MTLDDYSYTIRLDEGPTIDLLEERTSYYDSSLVATNSFRGRWEILRNTPEKVVLRLTGVDGKNASVEMALVVTETDIDYGELEWALRHHV